jgi:hypothetical protein
VVRYRRKKYGRTGAHADTAIPVNAIRPLRYSIRLATQLLLSGFSAVFVLAAAVLGLTLRLFLTARLRPLFALLLARRLLTYRLRLLAAVLLLLPIGLHRALIFLGPFAIATIPSIGCKGAACCSVIYRKSQ